MLVKRRIIPSAASYEGLDFLRLLRFFAATRNYSPQERFAAAFASLVSDRFWQGIQLPVLTHFQSHAGARVPHFHVDAFPFDASLPTQSQAQTGAHSWNLFIQCFEAQLRWP
jgi:hypothetical protein